MSAFTQLQKANRIAALEAEWDRLAVLVFAEIYTDHTPNDELTPADMVEAVRQHCAEFTRTDLRAKGLEAERDRLREALRFTLRELEHVANHTPWFRSRLDITVQYAYAEARKALEASDETC